jgi:hypothetical protein
VELRIGNAQNCEQNSETVHQVLPPARDWLIVTKRGICWRRQLIGSGLIADWTPWQRTVLATGERRKLAL